MTSQHFYQVIGFGAACIDLILPISNEFLKAIPGKKGGSQEIEFETLQEIIKKSGVKPYMTTGGSCANTIKALAQLDVPCAFMSRIGKDAFGAYFKYQIESKGITTFLSQSSLPSTQVLCLVTEDGDRTMRFFEGCSKELSDENLKPIHLKGVELIHFEAYRLSNGSILKKMMHAAKQSGAIISFDLSSFEIVTQYRDTIWELIHSYVDILFANQDEIRTLTNASVEESCESLRKHTSIATVILMGKEGCFMGSSNQIVSVPAYPARVIDTTGAGDFFIAGFLYGYLQNHTLLECAQLGNRLGSAIIEVKGTDLPDPLWQTIKKNLFV